MNRAEATASLKLERQAEREIATITRRMATYRTVMAKGEPTRRDRNPCRRQECKGTPTHLPDTCQTPADVARRAALRADQWKSRCGRIGCVSKPDHVTGSCDTIDHRRTR